VGGRDAGGIGSEMTSSERRITGWITVAAIFFGFHVFIGLLNLLLADVDETPV
jgi:hypothetical protein